MSSRRRRPLSGFTLIEVLLVLVILIILTSFAVLQFSGVGRSSKLQAAKVQVGLFDAALQTYEATVGRFPDSSQGLQALLVCPGDVEPENWAGPYLKAEVIPADPWGNQYQYAYPGQRNANSFDVWTTGPDGQLIGNWSNAVQ